MRTLWYQQTGPDRRSTVCAALRKRSQPLLLGLCFSLLAVGTSLAQAPPDSALPAATGTLHTETVRQVIYGFGGSQTYNGDQLASFANRDAVYKALFADLKLDILRLRNYYDYSGQEEGFEARTRDFARGALRWNNAPERTGKGPIRLMFTAWSPPAYLKSNNLVSGRSDGTDKGLENATLKRNADGHYAYTEYADWWLAGLHKFKELAGVYPDYIALQNELDLSVTYEGCRFLPQEGVENGYNFAGYYQALNSVYDKLHASLGDQAPRIVGPETFTMRLENGGVSHVKQYLDPATPEGKKALGQLFGISFHLYGAGAEAQDPTTFRSALETLRQTYQSDAPTKPLFETEFLEGPSLTSLAGMISDTFTSGGASAYLVWILARSVTQPGYALVYYNPYDGSVERRERFYAVKHFSAFVGEGYHRIETGCNDTSLKLSAYLSPNSNQLISVLINPTSQDRSVILTPLGDSFKDARTHVYRSTEGEGGERWRDLGELAANHTVTLPPHSVATVKFDK